MLTAIEPMTERDTTAADVIRALAAVATGGARSRYGTITTNARFDMQTLQ